MKRFRKLDSKKGQISTGFSRIRDKSSKLSLTMGGLVSQPKQTSSRESKSKS